jgi:hypothetical protein
LGDGIDDVQVTASGDVWVGYFDEGVFGNRGWGGRGREPLGAAGLVRWSGPPELRPAWRYPGAAPLDPIVDCYALNVDGEDAWICPYTDFPVVHVDRAGRVRAWKNALVSGARALLADPRTSTVVLVGGYGPERDLVTVARLDDVVTPLFSGRLVLPDGSDLGALSLLVGRGTTLHAVDDRTWLRLTLDDLFAQLT